MKKGSLFFILIAFIIGFSFLHTSKAIAQPKGMPIKIGYVGPVSHTYGIPQVAAAKFGIEEVNKAGGILGRPLELFIADSELKSSSAANAVHKLVEVDKVDFLIGCYGSEETMGAREAACDLKKVAIFAGGATHEMVTQVVENYNRYKYVFRNATHDELDAQVRYIVDEQVPWVAQALKKQLGIEKVKLAIVTDAAKWQDLSHGVFLKEFRAKGYEIVFETRLSTTATDTSVELTRIKQGGAHIILAGLAYKSTLPIIRQWSEMNIPAIWAGVNVLAITPKFWEQTGGKCVYVSTFTFGPAPVAITPETKMMWDYLQKEVGACYQNSHGPYVSILSLKLAAEKAKTIETEAMIKALENIKFDSVGGTIYYGRTHTFQYGPVGVGSPIWTIQHQPEGKFVMVHPKKYAVGELLFPPWMIKAWKK